METFKIIVFYLLLADALFVNFIAWSGANWYSKNFPTLCRYLPITKLWGIFYLLLVAWIAFLVFT